MHNNPLVAWEQEFRKAAKANRGSLFRELQQKFGLPDRPAQLLAAEFDHGLGLPLVLRGGRGIGPPRIRLALDPQHGAKAGRAEPLRPRHEPFDVA